MKKIFAAALVLLVVPFSSSAWDKLGHDVSAMIAWENMTSKAKKNISKYLEDTTTSSTTPRGWITWAM